MSPTKDILIHYIGRLEEDNSVLNRRAQELTSSGSRSADIKKALHDASNLVGAEITYKITDPDSQAVKWVEKIARIARFYVEERS